MVFKDSAKFWFPRINTLNMVAMFGKDINIPNTVFVDYNEAELFDYDNSVAFPALEKLHYAVEAAIRYEIGSDIAFIRTDVTSAKHLGLRAIKATINPKNTLNLALRKTIKHAETKTYLSKHKSSAIMVRSWIDMPTEATAFGGLPIGKEWRVFAGSGEVYCANGYWPKAALDGHMDIPVDISQDILQPKAPSSVLTAACFAALEMGGIWSVDFLEDVHGKIWLTDMATGENSYHHEDCRCGLDKLLD